VERVDEVIRRLNEQDKILEQQKDTLEQILWILKGSENLPIEGVLPQLKRMGGELKVFEKDLREMKDWREDVLMGKGKLDLKEAAKWVATIATAFGLLTAVYYFVRSLLTDINAL
jgi:hypothetical protein